MIESEVANEVIDIAVPLDAQPIPVDKDAVLPEFMEATKAMSDKMTKLQEIKDAVANKKRTPEETNDLLDKLITIVLG